MKRGSRLDSLLTGHSLPTGVVAIEGNNFTGRTNLLRQFVGLDVKDQYPSLAGDSRHAYLGPEIYNSLSGLALTVDEEIRLHLDKSRSSLYHEQLLDTLGLTHLRDRNPFDLSGGEQAVTALAAALALAPQRLSLDCCFEQIDAETRVRVLNLLRTEIKQDDIIAVADNRLREYDPDIPRIPSPGEDSECDGRAWPRLLSIILPQDIPTVSAPIVDLEDVRFAYRRHAPPTLCDISVRLEPGNIYILEGKNGSGKSTLAKILSGVLRPQGGTLRKDGKTYEPFREPAKIFAYHFQNPDLQLFCANVGLELAAGPKAVGLGTKLADRLVQLWAQVFGLSNALDCHPLDLPFVGRKRVALAATLTMARPWLILDEPTLGQDDYASGVLARISQELASTGYGIIVISHSRDFRSQLAGRRLLLEEGTLVEQE